MFRLGLAMFTVWSSFVVVCSLLESLSADTTTPFFCDDPKPVTDLKVTLSNYSHFVLTWTPPSNVVKRCIHAYKVCISTVHGRNVSCSSTWRGYFENGDQTRTTVCTNYTATVYAVGYPAVSNGTSVNFYTGAATVQKLVAGNSTSTATHLAWEAPDTLTCARHYKLYHCAHDGNAEQGGCVYQSRLLSLTTTRTVVTDLGSCKNNSIRLATVDRTGGENYVSTVVHTGNGHPPKTRGLAAGKNQGFSLEVSWDTPVGFNPQCHAGYRVCSISERDDQQCYFTNVNKLTVKKLTACNNYTISVQTVDGELREDSRRSDVTSLQVFTNPQPPSTSVRLGSDQVVRLSWKRDDNHSASCLRHYEVVECVERPSTGRCEVLHTTTLPANASSFNSSVLTGCAASHLYFYAIGKNGGNSSLDLRFISKQGTLHPPANLSVVSATSKHITLAWTPPEFNECPHTYRVCWNLGGYRTCESSDSETGDTFSNVTLDSCHTYTVKVWQMYKKNASNTIEVAMPIGPDNAGHQSVEVKPTSALMTWWRDTAAHRCNTGYRISWCPASIFSNTCGQSPTGTVSLPDTVSRYIITGLEMCVEYLLVFETLGQNESLTSEPNATIVHIPIGKFGPTTEMSIQQLENNTVTLTVVFPYNSTKCITKFTTCLYETNSRGTEKYCRLMRTEWTNMTQPCTNYTVDISAETYNKLTSNGSTTFLTGPGQVSDVSVKEDADTSADVTWTNPATKYWGCVRYLRVKCTPAKASGPVVDERLPADATGIHLERLSKCTYYTLQVQAVAAGGILGQEVVHQFQTTWSGLEKVKGLNVTSVPGGRFSLAWEPPSHRACVVSYRICWGADGSGLSCETTVRDSWTSSELDGLQPCTKYHVSVVTMDRYGRSSDDVTTTFQTGASAVTGVTVNVSPSGKAATVKWTYPESNVRCVSYQTVAFTRIQDNVVLVRRNVSKEGTQSGYGGLEYCRSYKVAVQPITLDGPSPPSVAKDFHTPSNVNSLSGLEVTALGQDALHINYSIAEVSSYCVDHFLICWEASGTNTSCSNKQGHTSSSVNITGLSPATNYTVHVTPVAPDGSRYHTTSATATTLLSVGNVVTDLKVSTQRGGQSVNVTWSTSQQSGESIDHLRIRCTSVRDHVIVLNETLPATATSLVISHLEPCVNYSVTVQPISSNSASHEAATEYFKTPSNVTSLSGLNVTGLSSRTLRVSYSIPHVSSVCVSHFVVCWSHSDRGNCTSKEGHASSRIAVTGLVPATSYDVTVTPVAPDGREYDSSTAVGSTLAASS